MQKDSRHTYSSMVPTSLILYFQNSLLRLEPSDINKMALECFACVMRYMGDLPLLKNQHEVREKLRRQMITNAISVS